MKILAIDMGWSNSVFCLSDTGTGEIKYERVGTCREVFRTLIGRERPDQVVIESGPMAGWVRDLCEELGVKLLVLNTNGEAWQWKKVKKKTDRRDAYKMVQAALVSGEELAVHVPERSVRQWRQLIQYRQKLVDEGVGIRNRIRAILLQEDLRLAGGSKAWEGKEYERLCGMRRALSQCGREEMWRGLLDVELKRLEELSRHVEEVERRLDEIGKGDERVRRLDVLPGVGPRTAEAVVAMLDRPERFGRARDVGSYAGLTPRKWQSGKMDRDGHISRCGNSLVRKLLVQAVWSGRRSNPSMGLIYEKVRRGSVKRKKQAVIATARHLLIWMWAMLRDGSVWRPRAGAEEELARLVASQKVASCKRAKSVKGKVVA